MRRALTRGIGYGRVKRLILAAVLLLLPSVVLAQSVHIDLGPTGEVGATSRLVQLTALVTVLSLAPSLLIMMTAFTRIVIVLSLLRSALSTQGAPPNMVLIGLSLFLSYFVMQPVLDQAWTAGVQPMMAGNVDEMEGLRLTAEPFHKFMVANLRLEDAEFFQDLAQPPEKAVPGTAAVPVMPAPEQVGPPEVPSLDPDASAAKPSAEERRRKEMEALEQAPWRVVVPAFVIGELRRAFEMGFLLFLPFLVIDMVVASVLMSLGMMMLPPSVVSLPFKLIFFVMADGWRLVAVGLVRSFANQ